MRAGSIKRTAARHHQGATCGVAEAPTRTPTAGTRQRSVSAFGGIAARRTLDEEGRAPSQKFTEVIIAPDATEEAIIVGAKKNLRLLVTVDFLMRPQVCS